MPSVVLSYGPTRRFLRFGFAILVASLVFAFCSSARADGTTADPTADVTTTDTPAAPAAPAPTTDTTPPAADTTPPPADPSPPAPADSGSGGGGGTTSDPGVTDPTPDRKSVV